MLNKSESQKWGRILAADEASKAILWPTQSFKAGAFDGPDCQQSGS